MTLSSGELTRMSVSIRVPQLGKRGPRRTVVSPTFIIFTTDNLTKRFPLLETSTELLVTRSTDVLATEEN